jgi:hypothetical protein
MIVDPFWFDKAYPIAVQNALILRSGLMFAKQHASRFTGRTNGDEDLGQGKRIFFRMINWTKIRRA